MREKIKVTESAIHLAVCQEPAIRCTWYNERGDVVATRTGSGGAGAYWCKLIQRLNAESEQPVRFCHGLKLISLNDKL